MNKFSFPRNRNLPEGISLLRQLSARADAATLNLGLGKPQVDMPEALRRLAESTLRESKLEYTENAGDLGVREALAQKLHLSSGQRLVLTHGAQEGLMAALVAILNRGDEVLVPDPGFLSYPAMVTMLGGKPVPYALKKNGESYVHDLRAIKRKITSRTRAILVSSPGNPTGCDLLETEWMDLLKIADHKKIVIISDEVYGMLHFKTPYLPAARLHERIISVNSFSKSHALTGWRIGYIASESEALIKACLIAHQYIATCASVPAQRLIGKLLTSPLYESVADGFRNEYGRKLELFRSESSPALRERTPLACGGFYLFPELPKRENSLKFCEAMLQSQNILAIPGSIFGKKGEGSIRLSLAIPDDDIKKAARVLSSFDQSHTFLL